jgi:hypothetical protein
MVHAPELVDWVVKADGHAGAQQGGYYMRLLGDEILSGQKKHSVDFGHYLPFLFVDAPGGGAVVGEKLFSKALS